MRELECVAEQVVEDLRELGRVRVKLCWQIGCDVDREFEATVARHAPETAFAVVGDAAQRDVFPADVHTPGFDLRQIENVVDQRSEEHTSELQPLMRISYAVFCLKHNTHISPTQTTTTPTVQSC